MSKPTTAEILKQQATRQFRHNTDNSPNVFSPKDGFVIAYDKEVIDKGLDELEATITALEAERAELVYRHECLKSLYSDEMNYLDDDLSVDLAIDEFISEEQSHS